MAPLLIAALLVATRELGESPTAPRLEIAPIAIASAPPWELQALVGAGPSLARRIRTYRELVAPLSEGEDLRRVPGIGSLRLHQWTPWLADGAPR